MVQFFLKGEGEVSEAIFAPRGSKVQAEKLSEHIKHHFGIE